MIENFDDILPPRKPRREDAPVREAYGHEEPLEGDTHSIREVGIESAARAERRLRRAERRPFVPEETDTRKSSVVYWAGGIVVLALALVVIALLFFVQTTVVVTPHEEPITLANNVTFTGYAEPEGDELGFTTYTNSIEKSTSLSATKTTYVERYASGVITIRNNYDSAPQRLIKNTRFESADGKIYRVRNSVTVPGKTGETPGTIDVTVYADVAGDSYNLSSGTFTVPGLKGDPRFDAFSAVIKTPITGGFVGNEPTVDEAELERTRTVLRTELETELLAAAQSAIEADHVFFKNLASITYEQSQSAGEGGTLTVTERGTIALPVFEKNAFTRTLLETAVASAREGAVTLESYDALTIKRVGEPTTMTETGVVQFTAEGEARVVWNIDTNSLANALAGKHQSVLTSVSAGYPGIERASATIRPFWKTSFPNDATKIKITTERTQ